MRQVLFSLAFGLLSVPALGEDVNVKDVHLCCGACVKAVNETLGKVDGVSAIKIDKDAGTVTFSAAERKQARTALRRLAKAGFAGEATMGGKALRFPKITVEKGTTSSSFEIKEVHLCCGGCVVAVEEALKEVKGVSKVSGDTETGVVKVEGDNVDVYATIETLRKAGFNGTPSL